MLDIGGTIGGYGSDITRTLWVTGGDPAKGPDERFRHLFGVLHGAQAAATRAVRPGRHARGGRRGRAPPDRGRGLRRRVLPPDRARDRPRGPRGPVHHRRQRRAAARGDGLLGRARDLPRRRVRRPDRGHRRLRAGRPDRAQRGAARAVRRRRLTGRSADASRPVSVGRPAVSSVDGSRPMRPATAFREPHDHHTRGADPAPPHQPGAPARTPRPMSRRHHGRPHHHAHGRPTTPRRVAGVSPSPDGPRPAPTGDHARPAAAAAAGRGVRERRDRRQRPPTQASRDPARPPPRSPRRAARIAATPPTCPSRPTARAAGGARGRRPAAANGGRTGARSPSGRTPAIRRIERRPPIATASARRPQLRRFIKSRPYVPMHELRRRFGIDGGDDDVTPVRLDPGWVYVGLPEPRGAAPRRPAPGRRDRLRAVARPADADRHRRLPDAADPARLIALSGATTHHCRAGDLTAVRACPTLRDQGLSY